MYSNNLINHSMKTKFFKSLLAIACLLSSTNVSAQANFFMVDSIYYMPNSGSSCTIMGHDPKHREACKGDLHIPDTVVYKNKKYAVTVIGLQAFQHTNFTSVTIPNTITEIGEYSFNGCKSLTNIVIPNSVTTIKEHAFTDCTSLTNITIPNSVTEIGWMAFWGCI